jgi:predicted short-subunit dehydrogenase-like oxidoreductase (DUF2520 family)
MKDSEKTPRGAENMTGRHEPDKMCTKIAIIGLGKVGTAVGYLLKSAGYAVVAVADPSDASIATGTKYTGGTVYPTPSQAAAHASCIFITTTDDIIKPVCDAITKDGAVGPDKIVVHMSGAGGLDLLESARTSGAFVASIHPIQTFATIDGAIDTIPGSSFGISAQEEIKEWSRRVVEDLGGTPFFIDDEDKPLYHAAACIASNYLVTLMNIVVEIYQSIGLSREESIKAFWPLVTGTIKNIPVHGTIQALTGPIARGDAGTIRKHHEAFRKKLPHLLDFYQEMGRFTVDIALKKGTLSPDGAQDIKQLLRGETNDE